MVTTDLHKARVRDILDTVPGTKSIGFRKAMLDLIRELDPEDTYTLADMGHMFPYVPDAYHVSEEQKVVGIYEVEDSFRVPDWKLKLMSVTNADLSNFYWELVCIIIDKHGSVNQINLWPYYERAVMEQESA